MSKMVKQVANTDFVSRHIFYPYMSKDEEKLVYKNIFEFPNGLPESVIWRKIVEHDEKVHQMGVKYASVKQQKNSNVVYSGFASSVAEKIRKIKDAERDGHGFELVHEPSEGEHHVHICYALSLSLQYQQLSKAVKQNLKYHLSKLFFELQSRP